MIVSHHLYRCEALVSCEEPALTSVVIDGYGTLRVCVHHENIDEKWLYVSIVKKRRIVTMSGACGTRPYDDHVAMWRWRNAFES